MTRDTANYRLEIMIAALAVIILVISFQVHLLDCKRAPHPEGSQELGDDDYAESADEEPVSESLEDLEPTIAPFEPGQTRAQRVNSLTSRLTEIYHQLRAPNSLSSWAICLGCRATMQLLFNPLIPTELLFSAFENVCTRSRLLSARVCAGYASVFHDDLEYIRKNTRLTRDEICGLVVGVHCALSKTENLFWTIKLPEKSTNSSTRRRARCRAKKNGNNNSTAAEQQVSSFVQVTDIHLDPDYEPGSLSICSEIHCCRATSGSKPRNRNLQAGKWGSYNFCDVPSWTVENVLERISSQHSEAKYWIWTGDQLPHDAWNVTRTLATRHIRSLTKLMKKYSKDKQVYPVVGNHEAVPIHSFAPPEIKGKLSTSWLYELLAQEWKDWLPEEALETFKIGGYYSVPVHEGLRIIVINTNYCSRLNPWTVYDPVDPAGQLKWLVGELLKAESNDEKVHLLGHIPADNRECTQAWLYNFIRIVDRFKATILAQYYAHTHRDEFRVIYSLDKKGAQPIGVEFVGPSVTTYISVNPSYRVYHQNERGYILDAETFYFNLTRANESPNEVPEWKLAHSFKDDLNTTGVISLNDWHNYLVKLSEDDRLFYKFQNNFFRFSDVKLGKICVGGCRRQMVGDMRLYHPYETEPRQFKLY